MSFKYNPEIKPLTKGIITDNLDTFSEMSKQINDDYWTIDHYLADLNGKWELSSVVCIDDAICGFIIVSEKENSLHVNRIVVEKKYQGLGIGKLLLEKAMHDCTRLQKKALTLKVDMSKPEVINFYKHLQFNTTGEQGALLLMELKIPV